MLIIIEGADLAGKTTLAADLKDYASALGYPAHGLVAGVPESGADALVEYELGLRSLRDAVLDPKQLVVADRWHLGETVYGPMLRGRSRLSKAQLMHVERYLDAMGALRVVLSAPEPLTTERYQTRGDPLVSLSEVLEAQVRFNTKAVQWRWRRLTSPYTFADLQDLVIWAGVECERAQHTRDFPGYVGRSWPLTLLVGDEPNGHEPGMMPNPAFMPFRGRSGDYLCRALVESELWDNAGLCNANDGTDVATLWAALDHPRVVALGRRAEARLLDVGVPHVYVPHPQYHKRFRYQEGTMAYGQLLQTAGVLEVA